MSVSLLLVHSASFSEDRTAALSAGLPRRQYELHMHRVTGKTDMVQSRTAPGGRQTKTAQDQGDAWQHRTRRQADPAAPGFSPCPGVGQWAVWVCVGLSTHEAPHNSQAHGANGWVEIPSVWWILNLVPRVSPPPQERPWERGWWILWIIAESPRSAVHRLTPKLPFSSGLAHYRAFGQVSVPRGHFGSVFLSLAVRQRSFSLCIWSFGNSRPPFGSDRFLSLAVHQRSHLCMASR